MMRRNMRSTYRPCCRWSGMAPPKQGTPLLVRYPPALIALVDQWATEVGVTRSEALRRLVRLGLLGLLEVNYPGGLSDQGRTIRTPAPSPVPPV